MLTKQLAGGKYHLIAADQSDCFLGARSLQDGSFVERSRRTGAMIYPHDTFTPRALAEPGGLPRLEQALSNLEDGSRQLEVVLGRVPAEWWDRSEVNQEAVREILIERAGRIREIVDYDQWRNLGDILSGGQLLGE